MGDAVKWFSYLCIFTNILLPCLADVIILPFNEENNIAEFAKIMSTSTCGQPANRWCRMYSSTDSRIRLQCGWCSYTIKEYNYAVDNLVDGKLTHWQSKNNPGEVLITFVYGEIFEISELAVEPGPLPYPSIWSIEASFDNREYFTVQRFVSESEDCSIGQNKNSICITKNKNRKAIAVYPNRPVRARYVRLRLQKVHDLSEEKQQPRRIELFMFYTLQNVKIIGKCVCNHLDKQCKVDIDKRNVYCECMYNKCGNNCERCCLGYKKVYNTPAHFSCEAITVRPDPCPCRGTKSTTTETTSSTTTATPSTTTQTLSTTTTTTHSTTTTNDICVCTTTTPPTPPTTTPSTTTTNDICVCTTTTTPSTLPTTTPSTTTKNDICVCTTTTPRTPPTTTPSTTTTPPTPPTTTPPTPPTTTSPTPPTTTPSTTTTNDICECTKTTTPSTLSTTTSSTTTTNDICVCTTTTPRTPPTTPSTTTTTPPTPPTTTPSTTTTNDICVCTTTTTPRTPPTTSSTTTTTPSTTTTNDICVCTATTPPTPSTPSTTTPSTTTTSITVTPVPCPCRGTKSTTTKATSSTTTATPSTSTTNDICVCTSTTPPTTTPSTTTTNDVCVCTTTTSSTTDCPCETKPVMTCEPPVKRKKTKKLRRTTTKPPNRHLQDLSPTACKKRIDTHLKTEGLKLNDWLCSLTDLENYPLSERWKQLISDLNYKIQILSEMIQRMPSSKDLESKLYLLLPHTQSLESFMSSFYLKLTEILDKIQWNEWDIEDLISMIKEFEDIEIYTYKCVAYVKQVTKLFKSDRIWYPSSEEQSDDIDPLLNDIIKISFKDVERKADKEIQESVNLKNKIQSYVTDNSEAGYLKKLQEYYDSLRLPKKLYDLQERIKVVKSIVNKTLVKCNKLKSTPVVVNAMMATSIDRYIMEGNELNFMAVKNIENFVENMKVLDEKQFQLEKMLGDHLSMPLLSQSLLMKEDKTEIALKNLRSSMAIAQPYMNELKHHKQVFSLVNDAQRSYENISSTIEDVSCFVMSFPFSKHHDYLVMNRQKETTTTASRKVHEDQMNHIVEFYSDIDDIGNDCDLDLKKGTLNLYLEQVQRDNDDIFEESIRVETKVINVKHKLKKSRNEIDNLRRKFKVVNDLIDDIEIYGYQSDTGVGKTVPEPRIDCKDKLNKVIKIAENCKLNKTLPSARDTILQAATSVSQAVLNIHNLNVVRNRVDSLNMKLKFNSIEEKIKSLKEKIKSAKKIVDQFKTPVNFESPAYVEVLIPNLKSDSGKIHLQLDIKPEDENGLILRTEDSSQGLQLELKLVDSSLLAEIGSNAEKIKFQIQKSLKNYHWYHFEFIKINDHITLKLTEMTTNNQSEIIKNIQHDFNDSLPSTIFLAGFPEELKLTKEDDFDGCLQNLIINEHVISLIDNEKSFGTIQICEDKPD